MKKENIIMIILSAIMLILSYSILCNFKDSNAIKDGEQNLSLYKGLISYLIENNPSITSGASFIAVDTNSFGIVSEQDKELLANYLKKYNDNIVFANYAMLSDPIFINDDGTLKGIYISASNIEIHSNKLNCEYTASKSPLNAVGYNVLATYRNGNWKVKYKAFIS